MVAKIASHKTLLQLDIATVFTTIGSRITINGPSMTPLLADGTDLDDATVQQIITGLVDLGELSLLIHFLPTDTTHKLLAAKVAGATPQTADSNWKLIFSDSGATEWAFSGPVMSFEGPTNIQSDGTVQATVTIKLNSITLPA